MRGWGEKGEGAGGRWEWRGTGEGGGRRKESGKARGEAWREREAEEGGGDEGGRVGAGDECCVCISSAYCVGEETQL